MSDDARLKEMQDEIVLLNQKTLFLLMSVLKHNKDLTAITDMLETMAELLVIKPLSAEKPEDMMEALAEEIAKARGSSFLN